jgi:hypothetical protein
VLEAFSPYFECRDVTELNARAAEESRAAPLAAVCGADTGEKRPTNDAAAIDSPDTRILLLSLLPASAGRKDVGGGGPDVAGLDSAELAAIAEFEAARARLGIKLP